MISNNLVQLSLWYSVVLHSVTIAVLEDVDEPFDIIKLEIKLNLKKLIKLEKMEMKCKWLRHSIIYRAEFKMADDQSEIQIYAGFSNSWGNGISTDAINRTDLLL